MDITIVKSQFNLVKELQLCHNVYFVDHLLLYRVGECFGQDINTCIHREMLNGLKLPRVTSMGVTIAKNLIWLKCYLNMYFFYKYALASLQGGGYRSDC